MIRCRLYTVVCVTLLLICGWHQTPQAQTEPEAATQIWIDGNPSLYLKPQLKLYGDIGLRKELEDDGWVRFVVRPSIRTVLKGRFHVAGGVGSFYTFNDYVPDSWEIRPFQGVDFDWPRGKRMALHNYIRLEERFDFNTATWKANVSLRFRYRMGLRYRWKALRPGRYWQVSAAGEAFVTLAGEQGQFQESSRVTLGVDRSFARDLTLRFEATWQQQDVFYNPGKSASDIYFRFRYTKRWGQLKA